MSHLRQRGKEGKWYLYYYEDGKLKGTCLGAITEKQAEAFKRAKDAEEKKVRAAFEAVRARAKVFKVPQQVPAEESIPAFNPSNWVMNDKGQYVGTYDELDQEQTEAQRQLEERLNISCDDFWEEYEAWASDPFGGGRSKNTILGYRTAWRHMVKALNVSLIRDVTADHVPVFIAFLKKKGVGLTTVRAYLIQLQAIYNSAAKMNRFEGTNPFDGTVKSISKPHLTELPYFLSSKELNKLLEETKARDLNTYLFTALGGHAGLRRDEIANLRWEQINFDNEYITMKAHREDKKKGIEAFRLKGKRLRSVPLKKELAAILQPYRKTEGYVLELNGASRFRYRVPDKFNEATVAAGVPDCTPHVLRHTFASLAVQAGVSLAKVQQWLGHQDPRITMIYSHLTASDQDVNKF